MESWNAISGFVGKYEVSNAGRVRRIGTGRGVVNGRILKTAVQNSGYECVVLWTGNMPHNRLVHRLVAEAFMPAHRDKDFVNHIDGIKLNNSAANLEWVTRSENVLHAVANLGHARGERNGCSVLTTTSVREIRRLRKAGWGYKRLARYFSVSIGAVRGVASGANWAWLE